MKTTVELTREAGGFDASTEFLERLIALVRADERESIAKEWDHCLFGDLENIDIGAAIRARSKT